MFKRIFTIAAMAASLALAGCSSTAMTDFNNGLISTTKNLVALNNAIIQVDITIINNIVAQQKLLAPYSCGLYNLGAAIVEGSPAAAKVNDFLAKKVDAGFANVAVKQICADLGYPTTVMASPSVVAAH